jgi:hypothetical protein
MIIKPKNTRASFVYSLGKGKTRTITLPMGVAVEVNLDKEIIAVRNFWSGAYEKWKADSDDIWIKLTRVQMDNLMNNPNFRVLEKWKPCM